MRSLVIALSIIGVLLCPYDCAVRAAAGKALGCKEGKPACCARCQAERLSENNSPQDEPRKDGHSCLCEGAVFTSTAPQELDSLLLVSQLAIAIDSTQDVESDSPVRFIDPHDSPPLQLSGREVRILNRSFLI